MSIPWDAGRNLCGPTALDNGMDVVTSHLGAPDHNGKRYETALRNSDGTVEMVKRSSTPDRAAQEHRWMVAIGSEYA